MEIKPNCQKCYYGGCFDHEYEISEECVKDHCRVLNMGAE